MLEKECDGCGIVKPLDSFHIRRQAKDGRVNKCKECINSRGLKKYHLKFSDPVWREQFREWGRLRYQKFKTRPPKYPEKLAAKARCKRMKRGTGMHLHHWSYRSEHVKDVIELSVMNHGKAHRFIVYDQERMMYRTIDGVLLDTKERHLDYIMGKINSEKD